MDIRITHVEPRATALIVPEFPHVRFDTGLAVYEEALIDGQYLLGNVSAIGRPALGEWLWKDLSGKQEATRPLRTRQHAFQIETDDMHETLQCPGNAA